MTQHTAPPPVVNVVGGVILKTNIHLVVVSLLYGPLTERTREPMIQQTHTPGPWQATEAEISTVEKPSAIVAWLNVVDPKPAPSREVGCGGNWKANARLIAAAPELLEALKDLVTACNMPRGPGQGLTESQAITSANEVITKATE